MLFNRNVCRIFVLLFLTACGGKISFAGEAVINIDCSKELGRVNKNILGSNMIGYDPSTYENRSKEYYGYSDFGGGVWDPSRKEAVEAPMALARQAGISMLRFPGGCGSHWYDWKKAIGKSRVHFLYGIDEFLKTCAEIGAEPVITVSTFTGSEQDAADLVEYLNAPDDGAHRWAAERAKNGHKEPYGVKYFEIGNEDWHGNHRDIKKVSPDQYAMKYLKYFTRMKAADPEIQIGAILFTRVWNNELIEVIGDKVDFGIIHRYPSPGVSTEQLQKMDSEEIFRITLAVPELSVAPLFQETGEFLRRKTGRSIPLAVTEYNTLFVQDKPVKYRFCLGTALVNAEMIRIMLRPENNVLFANQWEFCNSYFGAIANDFDGTAKSLGHPYYKRPNYLVQQLFYEHFGSELVGLNINCGIYSLSEETPFVKKSLGQAGFSKTVGSDLLDKEWTIKQIDGVVVKVENGVLKVDFIEPKNYDFYQAVKRATVTAGKYYKVSGYLKTDGIDDEDGVCLEIQDDRGWNATHWAVDTDKLKGTHDWQYVEAVCRAPAGADSLKVMARRDNDGYPVSGRAYFKDVKLEELILTRDKLDIPVLTATASVNRDRTKLYLIVVNRDLRSVVKASIVLNGFIPASSAGVWILNGPSIDSTNERRDNVRIRHKTVRTAKDILSFEFEPHSVTALEFKISK